MDKNTITGLVLIAAIFGTYIFFNNGKETDQTASKQEQNDSTAIEIRDLDEQVLDTLRFIPQRDDSTGAQLLDSASGLALYQDTVNGADTLLEAIKVPADKVAEVSSAELDSLDKVALKGKYGPLSPYLSLDNVAELDSLENDHIKVVFSNHGGMPVSVFIKDYHTYDSYMADDKKALQLFDQAQTQWAYSFVVNGQEASTKELRFTKVKNDGQTLEYRIEGSSGPIAKITYTIEPGRYHIKQNVDFSGIPALEPESVMLDSDIKLLSTEKHTPTERRASTIFYDEEGDYEYMSEGADDDVVLEKKSDWVAFKQSYFSAIVMPEGGFPAKGSKMEVKQLESEMYINQYLASLNMGMENGKTVASMTWYFGPNDYDLLKDTYDNGTEDIVNLGWGLFRWINVYMIRPLFNFFNGWSLGVGIAILLLTLVVKVILIPVTFKMYKSSAKMRALKPEIEEINKKYPDKADAQKRQMETMQLYGQTGVNPLSGCLPMLLQMPILFAVFRFFPSSLDLRQHSFLWAEDLSSYDEVLSWDTEIWGLSTIYGNHISLFTLLMAGTTLFYTFVNSQNMNQQRQPGMPDMRIMMYLFPFMMIFFFNSYSSGLSYYYFISTLMSILIMFSIKKWFVDEKAMRANIEAKKNSDEPKKKSKFQQRLEDLQRQQQEKNKNRGKK